VVETAVNANMGKIYLISIKCLRSQVFKLSDSTYPKPYKAYPGVSTTAQGEQLAFWNVSNLRTGFPRQVDIFSDNVLALSPSPS
jgi:hypothetical protein